ncbi:hypothetical protein BH23GEM11_BH23GEM11_03660 [soil metagenome]
MSHVEFADEILDRLRDRDPRFHPKAYLFVLSALHHVMGGLDKPRHISGKELAAGVRDLALREFGLLARTVLGHWGVHATDDVGDIVFALVDAGVLVKEEEDQARDFRALFDFEEVFDRNYPWGAGE